MRQARARLVISKVFFGSAAMALKFVEDRTIPTACTDSKYLKFNPEYINTLSTEEVEALIAHEVMHCIMLHHLRIQGRVWLTANKAMDFAVNSILTSAGFKLNPNWLYDAKYAGKSFEQIYSEIKKEAQEDGKGKGKGQGNGDQGQGESQDDQKDGQEDGQGQDNKKGQDDQGNGQGKGQDGQKDNQDGKGQGGQEEEDQSWNIGGVQEPKSEDGHALSESERAQNEADWKVTATQAYQQAEMAGMGSAGLKRLIDELIIRKRDLEDVLRDFLKNTLHGGYTWTRPNKKYIIRDLYMPSRRGKELPEIVMVMDTSGSVTTPQLNYFTAKLNSVLGEFQTHVTVIYCDTEVYEGGDYDSNDLPIKLEAKGGGGTDFAPAFDFINKADINPDCIIYYTDGYCSSFPEDIPECPVLWATYGKERTFPFGLTVMIDPNEQR